MAFQLRATRLKVNGQDLGNIKGYFSWSPDELVDVPNYDGYMSMVEKATELRIDTDAMTLADFAGDSQGNLIEQLQFSRQMIAYLESALSQRGVDGFRPNFVPSRIRLIQEVRGDFPFKDSFAPAGEYDCESNQWGAISVKAATGMLLGVKPAERVILAFVPNPHLEQVTTQQ